jgi:outer membrane protein OmpA-like peptidoglycan-associated protein
MFRKKGIYADNVCRATRNSPNSDNWEIKVLDKPISSHNNDGTAGLSVDGRKIFIFKGFSDFGYFEMDQIDGAIYMDLNKKYPSLKLGDAHVSSIAMSEDENIIIYSAYDLDGGFGKSDLWQIEKNPNTGLYGKPKNLGNIINTSGDEVSVSMLPDGKTIFFASNGHLTIGGYDIYRSTRIGDSVWEQPVNLGSPINTPANDVYFFPVVSNMNHCYYSSENPNVKGAYDIYSLDILSPILSDKDKAIAAKAAADKAEAERLEKERIAAQARKQAEKEAAEREKLLIASAAARAAAIKAKAAEREDSIIKAAAAREADLLAQKGYKNLDDITELRAGEKIMLKNVFFETGKATVLPVSYEELEKVYKLLVNNPNVRIEISGHTDNTGRQATNMKLSENRAKNVASYIEAKGIDGSRLVSKGYGSSVPIESNSTPDGRALNRRVEFMVLE